MYGLLTFLNDNHKAENNFSDPVERLLYIMRHYCGIPTPPAGTKTPPYGDEDAPSGDEDAPSGDEDAPSGDEDTCGHLRYPVGTFGLRGRRRPLRG